MVGGSSLVVRRLSITPTAPLKPCIEAVGMQGISLQRILLHFSHTDYGKELYQQLIQKARIRAIDLYLHWPPHCT